MARGENISKRKDGRWEARFHKARRPDGTIVYGYAYGKTYREAKEKAEGMKLDWQLAEINRSKSRMLFEEAAAAWLRDRKSLVKNSTWYKYSHMIQGRLNSFFGKMDIKDITDATAEEFIQYMMQEGMSVKTTKDYLVVVFSVMQYGARICEVPFVPKRLHYPKQTRAEMRVLSRAEQSRLSDFLMENLNTTTFGILLSLHTGIRIGELCALRWENVSLEEQCIRIKETMLRLPCENDPGRRTKVEITTPKSDLSIRTIPLDSFILELAAQFQSDKNHYILSGTERWIEPRTMQYRFRKYAESCSLKGVHFHTLRHTFATRCVEADVDIKCLSEMLGHSSVQITLDRYVHTTMELKKENMTKLDGFLRKMQCSDPSKKEKE